MNQCEDEGLFWSLHRVYGQGLCSRCRADPDLSWWADKLPPAEQEWCSADEIHNLDAGSAGKYIPADIRPVFR